MLRQGSQRVEQFLVTSDFRQKQQARQDGIDEGLGRGDAALRTCANIDRGAGKLCQFTSRRVGKAYSESPLRGCTFHNRETVRLAPDWEIAITRASPSLTLPP